jgi:hypothetical protein
MHGKLGRVERALRFILGAGLITYALAHPTQAWAWVGLLPLLTALMSWCPAYALARRQCRPSC